MRKYEQGDLIRSLDELMNQEFVMMNGKVYHTGWFGSWHIRNCKDYIHQKRLFKVEVYIS